MKVHTTYASKPAEASTCSSVILHNVGIHPKRVFGRSGRESAASVDFLRAAYIPGHLGRRIYKTWLDICRQLSYRHHQSRNRNKASLCNLVASQYGSMQPSSMTIPDGTTTLTKIKPLLHVEVRLRSNADAFVRPDLVRGPPSSCETLLIIEIQIRSEKRLQNGL